MVDAAVPQRNKNRRERPFGLIALILFQCFCTAFFVYDVTRDLDEGMTSLLHMLPEGAATTGLVVGVVFEVRSLNMQTAAPANLKVRLRRDAAGRWAFEAPINARAATSHSSRVSNFLACATFSTVKTSWCSSSKPPTMAPIASVM